MDLSPLPAARRAMLTGQPLAIAAKLDAGAVNEQVERVAGFPIRNLHRDPRLASAQRREVRHRPIEPRHPDQALDQPDRLAQRKTEEHFERQAALDRGIGKDLRPSTLAGLLSVPDHVWIEPDRQ